MRTASGSWGFMKASLIVGSVRPTTVCAFCGFGALFVALAGLMSTAAFDAAVTLRRFLGFVWLLYLDGEAA